MDWDRKSSEESLLMVGVDCPVDTVLLYFNDCLSQPLLKSLAAVKRVLLQSTL